MSLELVRCVGKATYAWFTLPVLAANGFNGALLTFPSLQLGLIVRPV